MLSDVADTDRDLTRQHLFRTAVEDVDNLTGGGQVAIGKNSAEKLGDLIPLERIGAPSKFPTRQYPQIRRTLTPGCHIG
jgi:hypothetical protein